MKKFLSKTYTLLLIALAITATSITSVSAQELKQRVINKVEYPNEPVQITQVTFQRKPITLNTPFSAAGDWIGGIAVKVKNTSGKPVEYVELNLRVSANGEYIHLPLIFGNLGTFNKPDQTKSVLQPNETFDCQVGPELVKGLASRLAKKSLTVDKSLYEIELAVERVQFDEITRWSAGSMFYRSKSRKDLWIREGFTEEDVKKGVQPAPSPVSYRGKSRPTLSPKQLNCGPIVAEIDFICCETTQAVYTVIERYVQPGWYGWYYQVTVARVCPIDYRVVCEYFDARLCSWPT